MSKILIADDSMFMRKILSDILTKNGFEELIEAENGVDALEKYKSEKPDLMILDIIMPEKTGIEILNEIGSEANILIVSAVGQEDMIGQAKEAGAKGYIVKPFEEDQVVEEVKKALKK